MSDPNTADLDDEWAEANAAAEELRQGIDWIRKQVEVERQKLRSDNDTDHSPN